jgi:hypothetical protein
VRRLFEFVHQPSADSSTPSVRAHIDMPKAPELGLVGIWVGSQTSNRNQTLSVISCEEDLAWPIETRFALLPLAREALDKLESFCGALRKQRCECGSR